MEYVRFLKGDLTKLVNFINLHRETCQSFTSEVYYYPLGFKVVMKCSPLNAFDGYHHHRLNYFKNMLNQLTQPIQGGQAPQFAALLYGPPGTGKSSFCRRVAEYLNRGILSVKLDEVYTKKDLYNIFFRGSIGTYSGNIERIVIELDELDKACTKLVAMYAENKRRKELRETFLKTEYCPRPR